MATPNVPFGGTNWQSLGAGGLWGGATNTVVGGGGGGFTGAGVLSGDMTSARSSLDWARIGSPGRTPEAEYPDGYLGASAGNGQYRDRLLQKIGSLNRRSYQRGVHKGERIDPGDYVWPTEWRPDRGIKAQKAGHNLRLAAGTVEPRLIRSGTSYMGPYDRSWGPPVERETPATNRRAQLGWLAPSWT